MLTQFCGQRVYLPSGPFWEGRKNQDVLAVLAAKVACGARTAQALPNCQMVGGYSLSLSPPLSLSLSLSLSFTCSLAHRVHRSRRQVFVRNVICASLRVLRCGFRRRFQACALVAGHGAPLLMAAAPTFPSRHAWITWAPSSWIAMRIGDGTSQTEPKRPRPFFWRIWVCPFRGDREGRHTPNTSVAPAISTSLR